MKTISKAIVVTLIVGVLSAPGTASSAEMFSDGMFSGMRMFGGCGEGQVGLGVLSVIPSAVGLVGLLASSRDTKGWGGASFVLGVIAVGIAAGAWISWAGKACNEPGWSGIDSFLLSAVIAGGLTVGLGVLRLSTAAGSSPRHGAQARRGPTSGFVASFRW